MICSRVLMPVNNTNDYDLLILLRTIEFTIYCKTSDFYHEGEILGKEIASDLSEYDKNTLANKYFVPNEFYLTPNACFDKYNSNNLKWNYNDDETNYYSSKIILNLLKKLHTNLAKEDLNFSFILFQDEGEFAKPFYIYCHNDLAKTEYDRLKDLHADDRFLLFNATNVIEKELPKANKMFLTKSSYSDYLENKLNANVQHAIDIVEHKLKN